VTRSRSWAARLRDRKLVQWALVYVAGAWLTLEVTDFLAGTFGWPPVIVRSLTVIAAVGLLAVLLLAWFHGERGHQRVTPIELVLLAALVAIAAVGVAVLGPAGAAPSAGEPMGVPTSPVGQPGVAVLPFDNLGGGTEDDYFGIGITEEIIAHLARLDGLLVIARSSVAPYAEQPPATVARELGVSHVLTGSVRRSADRVRVSTSLVDPASGAQIWGDQFEEARADIFTIQSNVARAVAAALNVAVSEAAAARIDRSPTSSDEAFDLVLQGRQAWSRRTGPEVSRAIDLLERAVEIDPEYADAWAALAASYAILPGYTSVGREDAFPQGLAAADSALALDSTVAEAHTARAFMRMLDWPPDRVEEELLRALELSPGFATGHHWYAVWLIARERFGEARAELGEASRLDPRSLVIATELGWPDYFAGRFERAEEAFRRVLDDHPDFELAWELTWGARELSGRLLEAATAARETLVLKGQPTRVADELESDLRDAYEAAGAEGYWRERMAWLERLGRGSTFLTTALYTAGIQARAGDLDAAFRTLDRAVAEGDAFLFFLHVDPALEPLREDPRFAALVERSGYAPPVAR
jgi:TolB-like protein